MVHSVAGHIREQQANEVPPLPAEPQLEDYLRYAALANPGLEAAFERWQAALYRIPQVTSLPDPRFTYRYYIEEVETRVGPQEHAFGLAQTFPWFGKLSLKGDMAAAAAEAERQRYEAARQALFYAVKDAYCEFYYLARAIAIVRANRDLMLRFEQVARKLYEGGSAPYAAVVRAQVELGRLENRLQTLEDLRGPIVAELNSALNRPVHAELPWPGTVPEESIAVADQEVVDLAMAGNPDLAALAHSVVRESHAIELASKDYFPDITLGLDYIDTGSAIAPGTPDSGKDPIIAMLSVNVPIWHGKYKAGEREARSGYLAAVKAREERANALGARVKMTLYRYRDAERRIDLFGDTLVPKAEQSLRAIDASFQGGEASFLDVVDALRVLLEFELSRERALADHAQRLAELEMLVGQRLPRAAEPVAEEEQQ
jgi:outer membrane protein TolC